MASNLVSTRVKGADEDSGWRLLPEVFLDILEILATDRQQRALLEFSLASKNAYRLAEPILVRELRVGLLSGKNVSESAEAWNALFSGPTAGRLLNSRSLVLGNEEDAFTEDMRRVFERALEECSDIESLELILLRRLESLCGLLPGLQNLETLKITLKDGNPEAGNVALSVPDLRVLRRPSVMAKLDGYPSILQSSQILIS
jgi:hypothetical protein